MTTKRWLKIAEAAKLVSIGIDTTLGLVHSGALKASNISTSSRPQWRIDPDDLRAFMEARSNQQAKEAKEAGKKKKRSPKPVREYV